MFTERLKQLNLDNIIKKEKLSFSLGCYMTLSLCVRISETVLKLSV